MKTFDVRVRIFVGNVEAASEAQACELVEKWLDKVGATLPGLTCPAITQISAEAFEGEVAK